MCIQQRFYCVYAGTIQESDNWSLLQDLKGYEQHLKHLEKAHRHAMAPNGSMDC